MGNTSATGGILTPEAPLQPEDADLDAILQALVAEVTGLDGSMVRPRWQPTSPKQPEATVDWCAIGVTVSTPDDGPYIAPLPTNPLQTRYWRHEALELQTSFYGPNSKRYAALLRDGLAINQNTEGLLAQMIRVISTGPIRQVPELVNQQWIRRQEMTVFLRRKVSLAYDVQYLQISEIHLTDDTGAVNDTVLIPPKSPWSP